MTSTLIKPPARKPLNAPTVRQLANGLTVIAEQLPVEAVNLSLWLDIGSAREPDSINGMAHFLEHSIFKGTPKIPSGEFERAVEQSGAVTNAATSQEYTNYYITSAPKDFRKLAPLLLEVVLNASIPDVAFERERLVVLEEIRRSEDNVNRRNYRRAMEIAFEKLPYRRSVLGPASVISQLTPQQMRDFHAFWYQAPSITAVATGNLPVEELIDTVTDAFKDARGNLELPGRQTLEMQAFGADLEPELPFTEIVRGEFVDPALQQARLMMFWRVPGLRELSKTYALDVLATILGQGQTSRLFRDLRENRGLVTSISASNTSYKSQGLFSISARLPQENLAEVEEAIAQHLRQIREEAIAPAEISRIRRLVANRFVFANETPSARANLYGYYRSVVGSLQAAFDYPTSIQSITAADVREAASKYLSPNAYGIVTVKPKAS